MADACVGRSWCVTHQAPIYPEGRTLCEAVQAEEGDDEALYSVGVSDGRHATDARFQSAQYMQGWDEGRREWMPAWRGGSEPEYVVDIYVPITCVPQGASTAEEAERIARLVYITDIHPVIEDSLKDTVFSMSDSDLIIEVGEG